jgi:hypothetical protein
MKTVTKSAIKKILGYAVLGDAGCRLVCAA